VAEYTSRKRSLDKLRRILPLNIRGFLVFVLFFVVIVSMRGSSNSKATSYSYILDVPYYDQKTSYYCGPATVMMVLKYTRDIRVSQDALSTELLTNAQTGVTYSSQMDEPFTLRNLSNLKEGRLTINQLKKEITMGYAPILLIWFDSRHVAGHYVVATGFNDTGVFVNDPWPACFDEPEGRRTGSFVYLSNGELLDLWSFSGNWAMTAAYAPWSNTLVKVDVTLSGLPDGLKTRLSLNGDSIESFGTDENVSLWLIDGQHVLSVSTVVYDGNGIGYYCTNNMQQVNSSESLQFTYRLLGSMRVNP
jgi:hypothetical protein